VSGTARRLFAAVAPTEAERAEPRPGDDLVSPADVVMDRGFTVPGPPDVVFPWVVQLGKRRAGWYLPTTVERLVPRRRRALRRIDPRWQQLAVGDVVPDWGGPRATFTVAALVRPHVLVYRSRRGRTDVSWSLVLREAPPGNGPATRVLLRLRMAPVRRRWLARTAGEALDLLTVAGMAAGLRERLAHLPDESGAS
jgi:hypothetical protein